MAYQEIYNRRLWKMSVGQGALFVVFAMAGIALIGFAISYHSGRITDRLLMIAIGLLVNCIGPLLWWSGVQTNREVQGLEVKFKEVTATGGRWRAYSESKNSPRWFEVTTDEQPERPVNFYDRWQTDCFQKFEDKLQSGGVPAKVWYVDRETGEAPILMRVEVDL